MKKFMNCRSSNDLGDSRDGHKRSDSVLSEETKQTLNAYNAEVGSVRFPDIYLMYFLQDPSLQEFDDLMRSASTLKVSLTPDRLKTMEVR